MNDVLNFCVFSKDGCKYCSKIQQVLKLAGLNFVTYKLGKNFDQQSFYGEFGEGAHFPQVILNGKKLGGCTDTVKYLKEQKLV